MASSPVTNPRLNKDRDSCLTSLDSEIISFTWNINNFLTCMKTYGSLKSTKFSSRKDNSKWYLNMIRKKPEDTICLNLYPDSPIKTSVNVIFECVMMDDKNREAVKKELTMPFATGRTNGFGFDDFASMSYICDEAKGLLPHGTLTISCTLQIVYDLISEPAHLDVPECNLTVQLNDLLGNSKISDITLMSRDGKPIYANKCILTARSEVFAALFADMSESEEKVVKIEGFNHDVLLAMLQYIYTGRTDATKEMPVGLLAAADAYALPRLKMLCEQELCQFIYIGNVVITLMLAECYGAIHLKKKAMDFMNANSGTVGNRADFLELMKSNPKLMAEVFRRRNADEEPSEKRMQHSEENPSSSSPNPST